MSAALDDGLLLPDLQVPLRVRSRLLDDEFWIVPDACAEPPPGVSYTVSEIQRLLAMSLTADRLRAVHAVKKGLDGTLHAPMEDSQ